MGLILQQIVIKLQIRKWHRYKIQGTRMDQCEIGTVIVAKRPEDGGKV